MQDLCKQYNVDYQECKNWYNGYKLNGCEIYNPESVVMLMENKEFGNYWAKTSSYKVIIDRLRKNFDGLQDAILDMLCNKSVEVDVDSFLNTMTDFTSKDSVLTYLIHIGYLAYNQEDKTCRIPNKEVMLEWRRAIKNSEEYKTTDKIIEQSKELLQSTIEMNSDEVVKALDINHLHATTSRSYTNEDGLQCAIYLSYMYAINDYTILRESPTGKGIEDMVYIPIRPENPALIIELKNNRDPDIALEQIRNKQYFTSLEHYKGNLLFVGINYDQETKKHTCKIEKFVKD